MLVAAITGCTLPRDEPPAWRLVPADELDSSRDILITLPLADAGQLQAATEAVLADHALDFVAEWPLGRLGVHCIVVRAGSSGARAPAIAALARDPRVDGAQPLQTFATLSDELYNDPYLELQHAFATLELSSAHAIARGNGVRVGAIDTGIDASHPDQRGQIAESLDFVGVEAERAEEHGTSVAGVVAALAGNGIGIVGVAPDADLIALRGCWYGEDATQATCSNFTLARALHAALDADIDVLNLSLQGPYDPLLARLTDLALAQGIVVVAAHEPDGSGSFPADLPGVIAVMSDQASESPAVDDVVRAPGTEIITTIPAERYAFLSGSSLASAHVAGVAALLRERRPSMNSEHVRDRLRSSARHGGVVNAYRALRLTTRQALARP